MIKIYTQQAYVIQSMHKNQDQVVSIKINHPATFLEITSILQLLQLFQLINRRINLQNLRNISERIMNLQKNARITKKGLLKN